MSGSLAAASAATWTRDAYYTQFKQSDTEDAIVAPYLRNESPTSTSSDDLLSVAIDNLMNDLEHAIL